MMKKFIIIRLNGFIFSLLVENGVIEDLHCQKEETENLLGNIYIGKVKKIVPNIQAAFIELSKGLECYYSINEKKQPFFTNKIGKKPLCVGDELLVQVSKDAVKTKVPSVTSDINLTGKYLVLTTSDQKLGISGKIPKEEKSQFREWLGEEIANAPFGCIVRTNAMSATKEEIFLEFTALKSEYESLVKKAATRTCFSCLKKALPSYLQDIQNMRQDGLLEIVIEDETLFQETAVYLEGYPLGGRPILTKYEDKLLPLHKLYNVEAELARILKEKVWLNSGAYLVIQPTEALTVIDVNTGKCILKKQDEENFLKINTEAAREIARQIRLRNLSGIIVVDFINMKKEEQWQELEKVLKRELKKDSVLTEFIDFTGVGLAEITRRKTRKPIHEIMEGALWEKKK